MPKKVSLYARTEQPVNWGRAFLSGVFGASMMMAFIDTFNMMGLTRFSLELYLGSLIRGTLEFPPRSWLVGVFGNWFVGGLFGILYGAVFESYLYRANARVGALLGIGHAAIAAVAVFPFFEAIRGELHVPLYAGFGVLGSGVDASTPILLFFAHLIFGVTMGTFYGPVRTRRVRARNYEPGEMGPPGDPDVVTEDEDPVDRAAV